MKSQQLKELKNRLPYVPKIMGKEEYFNSVILIPLMLIEDEYHLLFQKRSIEIRQGGEVSFPGGMHDPVEDRSIEDTAIRETYEEMGIPQSKITLLGSLDTLITPAGAAVDAIIGIVDIKSLDELKINHDEVEYAFSVPLSFFENVEPEKYKARVVIDPSYMDRNGNEVILFPARELGLPEMYSKPWGERNFKILVYKYEKEVIWGITARFVYDIVKRLR